MNDERIVGLTDVRAEVPLSEAEFAAIRRQVVQQMELGGTRLTAGRVLRPALTAATSLRIAAFVGMALIAIAAFLVLREPDRPSVSARSSADSWPPAAATGTRPVTPEAFAETHSAAEIAEVPPARRVRHPRASVVPGRSAERTDLPPSPAAPAVVRIEFQTSDPDVRIIWIQSRTIEETSR